MTLNQNLPNSQATILDEMMSEDGESRYLDYMSLGLMRNAGDLFNTLDLNFENILSHIATHKCR